MNTDTTPPCTADGDTQPDRDTLDDAGAVEPSVGIADWERYLDNGGEIERTLTSDCDACRAITEVHVVGPCGGVLAFCADPQACLERQLAASRRTDASLSARRAAAEPVKPIAGEARATLGD